MGRTSISCSEEAKAAVAERKHEDETWDEYLLRVADGETTRSDTDEVVTRLERLEEAIEQLETMVESSDRSGERTTAEMNAIREAVREEVRNQLQDLLR